MDSAKNEISLGVYYELAEGKREKDFENSNDVIIIDTTPDAKDYWLPCIIRAPENTQTGEIRLDIREIADLIPGSDIYQYKAPHFHKTITVEVPPKVLKINSAVVFHADQPLKGRINELHVNFHQHTQEVNLHGLHVDGRAHFEFAQYDARNRTAVGGRSYKQNTKLSLVGSKFKGEITFSKVALDDEIDLESCTFLKIPNLLSIADKAHISISSISTDVPLSGLSEHEFIELANRFRTFRKIAQKNNDHQSDVAHFANEHRALVFGKQFPIPRSLFFLGYDLISDFGRSIARPLQLLFVLIVGMATIYALLGTEVGEFILNRLRETFPVSIFVGVAIAVLLWFGIHKLVLERLGSVAEFLDSLFTIIISALNWTLIAFLHIASVTFFVDSSYTSIMEIVPLTNNYFFISGFIYIIVEIQLNRYSGNKKKSDWKLGGKYSSSRIGSFVLSILSVMIRGWSFIAFLYVIGLGFYILMAAKNTAKANILDALQLSINHALVPLALIRKTLLEPTQCDGAYLSSGICTDLPFLSTPYASLLLSFQALAGTILLFLIGVAIRHHLKLRW